MWRECLTAALVASLVSGCSRQEVSNGDTPVEVLEGGGTRGVSIVDPPTLSEALRGEGLSIRRAELLLSGSPFAMAHEPFEHRYLRVTVDDHQIDVFEFPDDETAGAAGSAVSADGWGVGGSQYEWIGPPHFWRSGHIIVLYAGDNEAFLETMTELLGSQFAGS